MTELEMTRLCAEAMGYEHFVTDTDHVFPIGTVLHSGPGITYVYDPLHDDAQAMALVKKFELWISSAGKWLVMEPIGFQTPFEIEAKSTDLNRAICECVAKMQIDRSSSK